MRKMGTLIASLLLVSSVSNAMHITSFRQDAKFINDNTTNASNNNQDDKQTLEWTIASGYLAITEDLTATFEIEQDIISDSDSPGKDSYNAWDNTFGLEKKLPSVEFMDKTWTQTIWGGFEQETENTKDGDEGNKWDTLTFIADYTASTPISEKTKFTTELVAKYRDHEKNYAEPGIEDSTEIGDYYELNFYFDTEWNEFWKSTSILYNEFVSYSGDGYKDYYQFELEHYTNFTYNLPKGFYFNTELGLESYGNWEFSDTHDNTEMWIEPKLGYSHDINPGLNLYAWVGYRVFDAKTADVTHDLDEYHNNKVEALLGFKYNR